MTNIYVMPRQHNYYVYILASHRNGTLYIGVTNSLSKRISQHQQHETELSFTAKYQIHKLVYYEHYQEISDALAREKQLKHWNRAWKLKLIEKDNPTWRDLFDEMKQ